MADPLRINVEVNVGDLPKLAEASQQVAANIDKLAGEFLTAGASAKEIADAVATVATQLVSSTPQIQAQATAVANLKAALAAASSEMKQSAAMITEAGGAAGVTTGFMENFARESAQVAILQKLSAEATDLNNSSLKALIETQAGAATAAGEQGTATTVAATATAESATVAQEAGVAFGATAERALLMGRAMTEGSEAAQAAAANVLALTEALDQVQEALAQATVATEEQGAAEGESGAQALRYSELIATQRLLQNELTAAVKAHQAALSESYNAMQAAATKEQEAAAKSTSSYYQAIEASNAEIAARARANEVKRQAALAEAGITSATTVETSANTALTASLGESSAATETTLSGVARLAQSMLGAGVSVQDVSKTLQQQGLSAAQTATALRELGIALDEVKAKSDGVAEGLDAMGRAKAYSTVRLAANEADLGQLGFSLARIGSISKGLGPILEAAFPIFAAVALIQVVDQLSKAFDKAIDSIAGYTDAVKKAEAEDAKFSEAAEGHALTLQENEQKLQANLKETGELASETYGEKWKDATDKALEGQSYLMKVLKDPGNIWIPFDALFTAEKNAGDAGEHLRTVNEELLKSQPALAEATTKQALALQEATEAAIKAGQISRVDQIETEITGLKKKQELEQQIARDEIASSAIGRGGGAAAAQAKSDADIAAIYTQKRIQLTNQLTEAQREQAQEEAVAIDEIVRFNERAADEDERRKARIAEDNLEEQRFIESYTLSVSKASAEETVKRIEAEDKYVEAVNKGESEAALKKIEGEEQQTAAALSLHKDAISSSLAAETYKQRALQVLDIADLNQKKEIEAEKLKIILDGLQAQQEALGSKAAGLATGKITPETSADWDLLAQWTNIQNQMVTAKAESTNKIKQLDNDIVASGQKAMEQEQKDAEKVAAKFAQDFTQAFNQVITGHERIGQAAAKLGQQLELAIIDNGIKKVVTNYGTELLKMAAEHSAFLAKVLGITVTSQAAQTTATATGTAARTNIESLAFAKTVAMKTEEALAWIGTEALKTAATIAGAIARTAVEIASHFATMARYAAEAAAAVYQSAAAIPFVGWIIAPIAAAAAFATVLAFEEGGIVPNTAMALVHKDEMVLPAPIATTVQGAIPAIKSFNSAMQGGLVPGIASSGSAGSAGASSRGGSLRDVHVHIGGNSQMGHQEIAAAVRKGVRKGLIGVPNF